MSPLQVESDFKSISLFVSVCALRVCFSSNMSSTARDSVGILQTSQVALTGRKYVKAVY